MQFDYNVGGLNLDIAGAVLAGQRIRENRAARRAREEAEQQSRDFRTTNQELNAALAADPNADKTQFYRRLAAIDPTGAKQRQDFDAEVSTEQGRSFFNTLQEIKLLDQQGRPDLAKQVIDERVGLLNQFGGSSRHSEVIQALYDGSKSDDERQRGLDGLLSYGRQLGLAAPQDPASLQSIGTRVDENGKEYDAIFDRATGEITRQYTGNSNAQELSRIRNRANASGVELSKEESKTIFESSERRRADDDLSNRAATLAKGFADLAAGESPGGINSNAGIFARFEEGARSLLGEQDATSFLRIEANNLLNSALINDLPPGVASDRDIEILQRGFPTSTANPAELANYFNAFSRTKKRTANVDRLQALFTEKTGGQVSARQRGADIEGIGVRQGETFDSFLAKYYERNPEQEPELLDTGSPTQPVNTPAASTPQDLTTLSDEDFLNLLNSQ